MESYPCPACGGPANSVTGCQSCGRPHDPDAAALALFQRTVASLEQKKRNLNSETLLLRGQLAHASAQRDSLRRKIRQKLEDEAAKGTARRPLSRFRRSSGDQPATSSAGRAIPSQPRRASLPPAPPRPPAEEGPQTNTITAERLQRAIVQPRRPIRARALPKMRRFRPKPAPGDEPEATQRSMQAAVLGLGGLLLAGAAIVLALFGTMPTLTRLALLSVVTAGALATPLLLARRGLRATGETVASVALLLVLLDGNVVRAENLFGTAEVRRTVYFGLICLVTAGIAAAYSIQSHLVAPRYATLIALQPVLPLLAYEVVRGPTGWGLVLCGVALVNLAFGSTLNRVVARQVATQQSDQPITTPNRLADELMRDLAWLLFAVSFGAASAFAITALATTETVPATLRAAAVVLLSAGIGVAGSLSWRRGPLPDVASGIATLAVIAAFARVGSVAMPGHTLLFTAGAVALATAGIPALPSYARRGPRYAGSAATAATALLLLLTALPAIAAPIRAVRPVWHADLGKYPAIVGAAAGPHAWQLVVATLLLTLAGALVVPVGFREDVVVAGLAFAALVAPAALGLSWLAAPVLTVLAAVAAGVFAITVRRPRTASILLASAAILGTYAAATSLADPTATALTLTAITIAGAAIALAPRPARIDPQGEIVARRVTDAAAGGAIFALPGAAAAATAIPFTGLPGGATVVLVMSYIALAVSLAVAAITQVARREQSLPLLLGSSAAAVAVVVAAFIVKGTTAIDYLIAVLMLASAAMLWLAPRMDDRRTFGANVTGSDAAAAAVTVAAIAAAARAVALAATGAELVTVAILVFAVSVGARTLPPAWRRGPVVGGAIVGAVASAYAGVLAFVGAIGVIRAADPIWHAPLGPAWQHNAQQMIDFGWQVPIALLLLAGAAVIAMPAPYGDSAAAATAALAAMAAPIALDLGWRSPMVLGWLAATGIALWAVLARGQRASYTRLVSAGVVGAFAAGASLVRPGATAGTLFALAASAAFVAGIAVVIIMRHGSAEPEVIEPQPAQAHLSVVGGTAAGGAVLALPGACAAAVAGLHPEATAPLVLSAALAGTSVALAMAGAACRRVPGFLAYVTAGVAASGTATSIIALVTERQSAVVYAAAAALLGVLAELVRAGNPCPGRTWLPARGFRPDRTRLPMRAWRQVARPGGFTTGVAAAAGAPAGIVIVFVAPAVVAALLGPYRWINMPWTGTPENASNLGTFDRFAGNGTHVLAAALLTLAAALVAVGLGGGRSAVINRSVAIIVPGIALTALITPAALRLAWPAQPTAALLVATLAGLGLALTVPPPVTAATAGMRFARRLVFVIAVLSAFAGGAGSLATKQQTLTWLAGSVVVGAIGGLFGKTALARMLGWHVAASTAEGFALAAGLAAGLPLLQCAFPLLIVVALLLVVAAALPRLRATESVGREALTIEAAGYAGALVSIGLTIGSASHTAAVLTALGAVLGLSAARPGRGAAHRVYLIIAASVSELIAIWLLLSIVNVAQPEAYTLPFAVLALITGLLEIKRRPELGSWVAYGPALVAGFAPTLAIVIIGETSPLRRVLLILAAVITVAIGALRRQKAPVAVGSVVTVIATLHELLTIGLPWPVLLVLFVGTGVLLVGLGATYEQRQRLDRLRGAYRGMR